MNLVEKKELVKTLPMIPINEFNKKVDEQRKQNWLIDKLIKENGSWENFPIHLIDDLFCRIGAKPLVNKY